MSKFFFQLQRKQKWEKFPIKKIGISSSACPISNGLAMCIMLIQQQDF